MGFSVLKILCTFLLASYICACSNRKTLSAEEISIQIGNVSTTAASAQLLCETFTKGQTTVMFFKTQVFLLADKANTAANDLMGNGGKAEEARRRGQMLATELELVCQRLESDQNAAATSVDQTRLIAQNATQLKDELRSAQ